MLTSLHHPHPLYFEFMFLGARQRTIYFGRKLFSFLLTALCAGLAGCVCGHSGFVRP